VQAVSPHDKDDDVSHEINSVSGRSMIDAIVAVVFLMRQFSISFARWQQASDPAPSDECTASRVRFPEVVTLVSLAGRRIQSVSTRTLFKEAHRYSHNA